RRWRAPGSPPRLRPWWASARSRQWGSRPGPGSARSVLQEWELEWSRSEPTDPRRWAHLVHADQCCTRARSWRLGLGQAGWSGLGRAGWFGRVAYPHVCESDSTIHRAHRAAGATVRTERTGAEPALGLARAHPRPAGRHRPAAVAAGAR